MTEPGNIRTLTSTAAGQEFATVANSQRRKKKRSKTSQRHKKQEPAGPRLFSDFGKFANDLLTKGYGHHQLLSITTQSCIGVIVTSRAVRHRRRSSADIGARYDYNNAAIQVNFDTRSSISTAFTFGARILPSTNIKASLIFPEYSSSNLNLKFHQFFRNAALSISAGLNQSPDLTLSTTIGTSSIALGMQSKYNAAYRSFTQIDAGISVTNRGHDASIILAGKGDILRLTYACHFRRPRKISAVAEVTRRLSNKKNSLAVGVSCIVDKLTTAKATLNNCGKLQALLVHKIKPNSSLNICGEFDVKALDKIPRIGLALALAL
ncbi:ARABIDOPSIS THALIANA VOLTAGE DEPENDENT ANION CHANNEL 2, voltage dependent anion channel 2 [Hibiscus trionum]|uniref:ARABIDOPSIS THALIANA VOLTAGE DEPENDENT ANION CHANNEL 2, voltage dependent anion channel 2 n=1 Tax=Hibiscus trionum TaxID=183268 RepID=A0A9W7I685_HIBTR|nr:ARABIDOPSIS THALIANA VOLTAGE DEPENDENT ANION CHANNEL 2, voltage dependent anion channel 2 [Hibiscus trionum]